MSLEYVIAKGVCLIYRFIWADCRFQVTSDVSNFSSGFNVVADWRMSSEYQRQRHQSIDDNVFLELFLFSFS